MEPKSKHIYRHHGQVKREDRCKLNGQRSALIWLTGLPSSGKSTIAHELDYRLFQRGLRTYVLDGDNVRHGLNKDLGFSAEDRKENLRRVGEVAKLFVDAGVIAIAAFISPYVSDRLMVRALYPAGDFIEVYVKCGIEVCESRDPKGLYKKARTGEVKNFTGVSDPYEAPKDPEIVLETDKLSVAESVNQIIEYLSAQGMIGPAS